MIEFLSNLMFKIVKPIATKIMLKKGYPQDAIDRKSGIIPEEGFNGNNVIMLHGVSVGETNALENLIKQTRQEFPNSKLIYTTGTYTGQELAKNKFSEIVDLITYFPADFPCVIKKFLDKVNPSVVMIAETEIWPFFARECKKRGIKLYIINGRISDSTFKSYKMFKFIFKYFLSFYTGIYTQSEDDNQKFLTLGANPETTKKMSNLKFDIKKPDINIDFVKSNNRIFLAGSTHSGEDEVVLNCFKQLKERHPDLKMILAPRHLTRTAEVKTLIEKFGFDYALRSEGKTDLDGIAILLLDTLGELGKMYNFADISFIGGSFNKTGGHNPLESIVFNKPVISGPSTHNFKDIYSIIKKANAGFIVENEQELFKILNQLFSDLEYYNSIVNNCKKVFAEQQGALQFVINILKTINR